MSAATEDIPASSNGFASQDMLPDPNRFFRETGSDDFRFAKLQAKLFAASCVTENDIGATPTTAEIWQCGL